MPLARILAINNPKASFLALPAPVARILAYGNPVVTR